MATDKGHTYDELVRPSLRLFMLEVDGTGQLGIKLFSIELNDHLSDYIALSYTWKPRFLLHSVKVNSGQLSISHNL